MKSEFNSGKTDMELSFAVLWKTLVKYNSENLNPKR